MQNNLSISELETIHEVIEILEQLNPSGWTVEHFRDLEAAKDRLSYLVITDPKQD